MTTGAYLRYPHLYGDLVAFVADDDVWLAPVTGGRAWRFTADRTRRVEPEILPRRRPPRLDRAAAKAPPRCSPPSRRLAGRAADVLGHPDHAGARLDAPTGGCARSAPPARAVASTWAHEIPLDGGPATRLPYGSGERPVHGRRPRGHRVATMVREPANWKRYRGGTAGKLWIDADGSGEFTPPARRPERRPALAAMWVGRQDRLPLRPRGHRQPLLVPARRHRPAPAHRPRRVLRPARRAPTARASSTSAPATCGCWTTWTAPSRARSTCGSAARAPAAARPGARPPTTSATLAVDPTGRASAVEVRGTVHWLTHRDGPARALRRDPGRPGPAAAGAAATAGQVALGHRRRGRGRAGDRHRRGPATRARPGGWPPGELGRVLELAASPDGHRSRSPRTTAGCCWSTLADRRRSPSWPRPRDGPISGPGLLARLGLAGLVPPGTGARCAGSGSRGCADRTSRST